MCYQRTGGENEQSNPRTTESTDSREPSNQEDANEIGAKQIVRTQS